MMMEDSRVNMSPILLINLGCVCVCVCLMGKGKEYYKKETPTVHPNVHSENLGYISILHSLERCPWSQTTEYSKTISFSFKSALRRGFEENAKSQLTVCQT